MIWWLFYIGILWLMSIFFGLLRCGLIGNIYDLFGAKSYHLGICDVPLNSFRSMKAPLNFFFFPGFSSTVWYIESGIFLPFFSYSSSFCRVDLMNLFLLGTDNAEFCLFSLSIFSNSLNLTFKAFLLCSYCSCSMDFLKVMFEAMLEH